MLGGLQRRSGRGDEEKYTQPLPGLEPPVIQPVAQCCTAELSRFLDSLVTILIRENGDRKRKQRREYSRRRMNDR
jgi:hypothetical protein